MIRALMQGTRGQPLVLLGLGDVNLERLRADEPIHVSLRDLAGTGEPTGLPDIDVIIAFDDGELAAKMLDLPKASPS